MKNELLSVVIICYQKLLSFVIIYCFPLYVTEFSKIHDSKQTFVFLPSTAAISDVDCFSQNALLMIVIFCDLLPRFFHWDLHKTNGFIQGFE